MTKRCDGCRHYWEGVYTDTNPLRRKHCTLQPVWLEVSENHFCSQHLGALIIPAEHNRYQVGGPSQWERAEAQKKRAIKAEKAAKELRAKIRELKAGAKRD